MAKFVHYLQYCGSQSTGEQCQHRFFVQMLKLSMFTCFYFTMPPNFNLTKAPKCIEVVDQKMLMLIAFVTLYFKNDKA